MAKATLNIANCVVRRRICFAILVSSAGDVPEVNRPEARMSTEKAYVPANPKLTNDKLQKSSTARTAKLQDHLGFDV
jgi:hypothetical protein